VRVSAQLADAATGAQIWAERYDRVLADIFALQDEITDAIVAAMEPELGRAEQRRAQAKTPEVLGAWEIYQRGAWHLYKRTGGDLEAAQALFERSLVLDPTLTAALCGLVDAYYYGIVLGLTDRAEHYRELGITAARRAVELDSNDAAAHCAVGKSRLVRREHALACPELERALELNPSLAWAHYGLGAAVIFSGSDPQSAIPHLQQAIRLSPRDLHMGSFMVRLADAYLALRDYRAAAEWARKSLQQPCFQWSRYAVLLSALGHMEEQTQAREVLAEVIAARPDFCVEMVRATHLYADSATFAHYLEGLCMAGVSQRPAE
jgi:tetratricopeptide (TPR) repeat protein